MNRYKIANTTTKRVIRTRNVQVEEDKDKVHETEDKDKVVDTSSESEVCPGPQRNKNGPKTTKFSCFTCGKMKWCIDFHEGKAADLGRKSTCLFCDLKASNKTQNDSLNELKLKSKLNQESTTSILARFEQKLKDMQDENTTLRAIKEARCVDETPTINRTSEISCSETAQDHNRDK